MLRSCRRVSTQFGCIAQATKSRRSLPELKGLPHVNRNLDYLTIDSLEQAVCRPTASGAMAIDTNYTGRSPNDKFVVEHPDVWWGPNRPMKRQVFETLTERALKFLGEQDEVFVFDGYAGRGKTRMKIRIVTTHVWQHHFCKNMFVQGDFSDPDFTVYTAADVKNHDWQELGLQSEAAIAFDLDQRKAVIMGTQYPGEMKKGIFTVMHFFQMPRVLTMHCSANVGMKGDVCLFFGLSGTGKTTLSTSPRRPLIGDDEHGWDDDGVWNIEGGCYAKVINLSPVDEPLIYAAIKQRALLENVDIDQFGVVDYASSRKTTNTRVSYPLSHIPNRVEDGIAGHPANIIFLACDATGVLPPVSKLTADQATYHFLSGYTSKVAGTERGLGKDPVATFSACYGAAFLPLHPTLYADLFRDKIAKHNVHCYLVNSGWAGGPVGVGDRMPIKITRACVDAVFDGSLDHDDYTHHPILNLAVPNRINDDLPIDILHPWKSWAHPDKYDQAAAKLAQDFVANFTQFQDAPDYTDLLCHGPQPPAST